MCSLFASLSGGGEIPFISDSAAWSFRVDRYGYHATNVSRFPYFLLRRQQQKINIAHIIKAATPPTTPPIIAPRFEDAALGVLDGVLDGKAVTWLAGRTEDNAVAPVVSAAVDVSEMVEVCELTSRDGDMGATEPAGVTEVVDESVVTAVVDGDRVIPGAIVVLLATAAISDRSDWPDESSESPSSGHMPVVHGSLEQHPRKLPIVQTYHSLPPVQVLMARGKRGFISSVSV